MNGVFVFIIVILLLLVLLALGDIRCAGGAMAPTTDQVDRRRGSAHAHNTGLLAIDTRPAAAC